MSEIVSNNPETVDASMVNEAERAIVDGDIARAKHLLKSVVQNAPNEYEHQTETEDGALVIKFWDRTEFIHYVTWQNPTKEIRWIQSAYPRAFYYLGYIAMEEGQYRTAIDYLDSGAAMEPTNPKFVQEKAHALMQLGQHSAALDLLEQISEVGPFVNGHDVAAALRGRGCILIEKGLLAEAEEVLMASLKLEPDSKVAHNELAYIKHLRRGGKSAQPMATTRSSSNLDKCAVCGSKIDSGKVLNVDGIMLIVCERCRKKISMN